MGEEGVLFEQDDHALPHCVDVYRDARDRTLAEESSVPFGQSLIER